MEVVYTKKKKNLIILFFNRSHDKFLAPPLLTACSLPSAGDRSNIILGVLRSNHKEQGKFKEIGRAHV